MDEPMVFVVDEDSAARKAVAALARSKGLAVKQFASAEELLANADRSRLGCLVTELQLPGISGLELQKKLQTNGMEWPVVFVADRAEVRNAVEALRAGAITFLKKPWGDLELWTGIREALQWACRNREDRQLTEAVASGKSKKPDRQTITLP